MPAPLPANLRSHLDKTIREARRVAEAAAEDALQALAVDRDGPHESMSLTDRGLRDRLRARGRQLGDRLDPQMRTQEIGRLGHEVAYEHWHRMLFARFLAENDLLVEPEGGVAVSLEECGALAREEETDRWALAGGFAARMLPGVFRRRGPVHEVAFSPEARLELERLLESLPEAVFLAGDSLGWTYQFWQASRKDQVNKSGGKIGADELPTVTQLFTERYMVLFLFHNTIGAWRAAKVLGGSEGCGEYETEEDLQRALRIKAGGGYDFSYLRFVRDEDDGGKWHPAAGWFEKWPRTAAELRVLDPCCGSGHFLIEGLELLARLRMEEEGLSVDEAVRSVLAENLHGLEIDPRCAQIAAFNLALTAWRLAGEHFDLPRLKVACCGLAPNATEREWMALADKGEEAMEMQGERNLFGAEPMLTTNPLQDSFAALHKVFQDAPDLGSLIDPHRTPSGFFEVDPSTIRKALSLIIEQEDRHAESFERAVAAEEIARSLELLDQIYTLVITNVPFLARGKQSAVLRRFGEESHSVAKGDLATMFVSRILRWLAKSGTQALVVPQNWLFLSTYRKLREELLKKRTWNAFARLGMGAFETVSGHVVNVCLNILSSDAAAEDWRMAGIDVSTTGDLRPIRIAEKDELLKGTARVELTRQTDQLANPDARLLFRMSTSSDARWFHEMAICSSGIQTGDDLAFIRSFWEINAVQESDWEWQHSTTKTTMHYSGQHRVIRISDKDQSLVSHVSARLGGKQVGQWIRGKAVWNQRGIIVSPTGAIKTALYLGNYFDANSLVVIPKRSHANDFVSMWTYCSSEQYHHDVREIDRALKVGSALVKVPIDIQYWQDIAKSQYPNGLPEPYSDDPTQWLFHGHPCGSVVWNEADKKLADGPLRMGDTVLQIAVARLLGYRWPAEHDEEIRLAKEAFSWLRRCHQLDQFADGDGIVCIPAVGGERSAQDRLRDLLRVAYGAHWAAATERELLGAARGKGRIPASLDTWLRDGFFEQHCKLFHDRPFVWHIWDGRRDGFHALINYHHLVGPGGEGRRTLESLAYRYLGTWIEQQRGEQRENKPGADARLAAALDLQQKLECIAAGEPPLDIFVRWRPLHSQPIGWEPDIDDGVRLNIRPFMRAELRTGGRKGAGILRHKPNVKWGKDRGKEPEHHKDTGKHIRPPADFPWFWSCPGGGSEAERTDFQAGAIFDGNRWNDLHYTRSAKAAARAEQATP